MTGSCRRATVLAIIIAIGGLTACGGGGATLPQPHASGSAVPSNPGNSSHIDWPTFGFSSTRSNENLSETQLTASTVSTLHLLWSRKIGDSASRYADTQPVVAANVPIDGSATDIVYAGDEHGFFVAVNAANGNVVWSKHLGSQATACADIPDQIFGITDTPVIDRARNRIYVVDGQGILMAFDLGTGNVAAGWPSSGVQVVDDPTLDHVWSGLSFDPSTNLLFVPTASYCDYGQWNGALRAVNVLSASVTTVFYFATGSAARPSPPSTNFGGGVWSWGGISIDGATHNLYSATGNLIPNESATYSDSIVEWDPSLTPIASAQPSNVSTDGDFGSAALLYDDAGSSCAIAVRKEGTLFVFDRTNIAAGPTFSLQLVPGSGDLVATPAHSSATHLVYVNNPQSGNYGQGLYAFAPGPGCTLNAAAVWSQAINVYVAPPTIAGGVVYDPAGSQLLAFDATTGARLWNSGSSISGNVQNGVSVVNGKVYAVDWNDTLYAFGL